MRGKGGISRNVIFHCRITPAYAEKRSSTSFKISSYQDHPRLCGEKRTECYTKSAAWGSPPPMRGKVAVMHWFAMMQRITPAYAGKRAVSPGGRKVLRDHPRLCGEKCHFLNPVELAIGSPPPMRGKALSHICCCRVSWITPAYAGKSKPSWSGQACMAGSPPPMRGKAAHLRCRSLRSGITPAYAGKSGAPAISPVMMTDHPRLCGEKSSPFCAPCAIRGSPPPMRGKVCLHSEK